MMTLSEILTSEGSEAMIVRNYAMHFGTKCKIQQTYITNEIKLNY
jgi:hypothetical protein